MSKRNIADSDKCPITFALDIFGDRWSLLIIRDLLFKEKSYYGDFLSSSEKISTNILADRLGKLELTGIVSKTQDSENLSKYIYKLTKKGKDLLPLMLEMVVWSTRYNPQPDVPDCIIYGAPENLLERIEDDKQNLITEILSKLD